MAADDLISPYDGVRFDPETHDNEWANLSTCKYKRDSSEWFGPLTWPLCPMYFHSQGGRNNPYKRSSIPGRPGDSWPQGLLLSSRRQTTHYDRGGSPCIFN